MKSPNLYLHINHCMRVYIYILYIVYVYHVCIFSKLCAVISEFSLYRAVFFFPRHLQRFGQRCVPCLQCTPPHLQSRLVRHRNRCRKFVMIYIHQYHMQITNPYIDIFLGEILHPTFCSDAILTNASTGSCHALQ